MKSRISTKSFLLFCTLVQLSASAMGSLTFADDLKKTEVDKKIKKIEAEKKSEEQPPRRPFHSVGHSE